MVQYALNPAPLLAETGLNADPKSSLVHAQQLLNLLHEYGHAGDLMTAADVRDKAYPELCAREGWQPLPWHGPDGVGKRLAHLCGGRTKERDAAGRWVRGYRVPARVLPLEAARRA